METRKFYLIVIMLFSLSSFAQITKGNWMMGGVASFSHNKYTDSMGTTEANSFSISPNVGYFFMDKLVVGASGLLSSTFNNTGMDSTNYGIGPFARYYFLDEEKPFNIFSEISYGLQKVSQSENKIENFNVKAGAVYFLNSSVGLEAALNYSNKKYSGGINDATNKTLFLSFGFQIHLERE